MMCLCFKRRPFLIQTFYIENNIHSISVMHVLYTYRPFASYWQHKSHCIVQGACIDTCHPMSTLHFAYDSGYSVVVLQNKALQRACSYKLPHFTRIHYLIDFICQIVICLESPCCLHIWLQDTKCNLQCLLMWKST